MRPLHSSVVRDLGCCCPVAERERFELSRRSSRLPAFEAGAFNRSTTSPYNPDYNPDFSCSSRRLLKNVCSCREVSVSKMPAVTST